jgi:hypothetical protein
MQAAAQKQQKRAAAGCFQHCAESWSQQMYALAIQSCLLLWTLPELERKPTLL